jgi:class 3 adenylate cyclase
MTTRRLAAILAADVVGFSSMMERNEERTLARPKARASSSPTNSQEGLSGN